MRPCPQLIEAEEMPNLLLSMPPCSFPYSHSIVDGGFEEMSYTTRLTPLTSLTMREELMKGVVSLQSILLQNPLFFEIVNFSGDQKCILIR